MKILEINSVNYGSTGKIMYSIADVAREKGHEVFTTHGFTKRRLKRSNDFITSSAIPKLIHTYFHRFTGYNGVSSFFPTLLLISRIRKINPDLIQLHNLHGWYLNLPIFFKFLKKYGKPVVWTLHDCWSFTGRCPHFLVSGCTQWKKGCRECVYPSDSYPQSRIDRCESMWNMKKKWFSSVPDLHIVTPSVWLKNLVSESFLKDYDTIVINNGIDLNIFKPTESDFREKHHLENKCILMGIADVWGMQKGLDVFIELSKRMSSEYQIVLVGTDVHIDRQLPNNIISIHRTHDQTELAEIYTAADFLINPTREDTYPTVNMEAMACGTPVIAFNTGGCPEMLDDSCGAIVMDNSVESLEQTIIDMRKKSAAMYHSACIEYSRRFNAEDRFCEYIDLYEDLFRKSYYGINNKGNIFLI